MAILISKYFYFDNNIIISSLQYFYIYTYAAIKHVILDWNNYNSNSNIDIVIGQS
jgi:hypothetical protein